MSLHVFACFITPLGTAANNRGENEGNITTLQKLIWNGQPHTTVSAEAIRFALRRRLASYEQVNRGFDEVARVNTWQDPSFSAWAKGGDTFIDDDLLGYMSAAAASEENAKGSAQVRRAVLEVSRAVSLVPWAGDVTFNAASPGATPSAAKKDAGKIKNPVPYGTEVHATRYQYGVALTPERLDKPARAALAVKGLCSLGPVAGNHGRFLFDFSPESVVLRVTDDPAPRLLYCFSERGGEVGFPELVRKVRAGDIPASELIIGGAVVEQMDAGTRSALDGAALFAGVRRAADEACRRMEAR